MTCFLRGIVSHDPSQRSRRSLVESVATTNQKQMLPAFATTNYNRKMELIKSIGSGKALGALKAVYST